MNTMNSFEQQQHLVLNSACVTKFASEEEQPLLSIKTSTVQSWVRLWSLIILPVCYRFLECRMSCCNEFQKWETITGKHWKVNLMYFSDTPRKCELSVMVFCFVVRLASGPVVLEVGD